MSSCELCRRDGASESLPPDDFKVVQSVLNSFQPEVHIKLANNKSSVFCSSCETLLQEAKRLHILLNSVSSQLKEVVAKVQSIYEGSNAIIVLPKKEPCWTDDSCDSFGNAEFIIEPEPALSDHSESEEESNSRVKLDTTTSEKTADLFQEFNERPFGNESSNESSKGATGFSQRRSKRQLNKKQPKKSTDTAPSKSVETKSNLTFPCRLCDITFNTKFNKLLHDELVHLEGASDDKEGFSRLYSNICGKSSYAPGEISAHEEKCHPEFFKFICTTCSPEKKFISEKLLNAHKDGHCSQTDKIRCSLCSENSTVNFATVTELDNHLSRVHFYLLRCSYNTTWKSNRVGKECDNADEGKKLSVGNNRKPHPCRFCGVIKQKNKSLFSTRVHERKEHPEKFIHICNYSSCGSSYSELNECRTCEESHKEVAERSFTCFVCNGRFDDPSVLKEHLEDKHTHGGVKCQACSERVAFKKHLQVHMARLHGGEWPFKCHICDKGFDEPGPLNNHILTVHRDEQNVSTQSPLLMCEVCSSGFPTKRSLWEHKTRYHSSRTYDCDQCGKALKTKRGLEYHKKSHLGIKDIMCEVCGKAFLKTKGLQQHKLTHTGERPFGCHICSKAFAYQLSLKKHLDVHKKNGTFVEKPRVKKKVSTSQDSI